MPTDDKSTDSQAAAVDGTPDDGAPETPAAPDAPVIPDAGEPPAPATEKTDDATPAAAAPATPEGAPETYDLKLPDQTPFTPELVANLEAEARVLNLTNAQAQTLLDARQAAVTLMGQQYLDEALADPEIGGAKFEETKRLAQKGAMHVFVRDDERADFKQWVESVSIGNKLTFLRAFSRVGRSMTEDPPPAGTTTRRGAERKSDADVMFGDMVAPKS